ncbi:hypothetical protein [Lysinibacillus xylanilyticus]|uniref:hypothetical protein n=1 Tax=Lysinibacillus xylanilyticus TaxID=582475 RepID=UPI003D072267
MIKKIGIVLFAIGIVMIFIGMPYLLGYSTNEFLKYPLYLGLLVNGYICSYPNKKKVLFLNYWIVS